MKFQLFGRLRDNGEEHPDSKTETEPGMNNNTNLSNFGGGLQRTVENMFSQGYSEEEVRQELLGQYSDQEIQDAINQAVTSSATSNEGNAPEPMTPYEGGNENMSPMDEGYGNEEDEMAGEPDPIEMGNKGPGSQVNQEMQQPQPSPGPAPQDNSQQQGSVEELIETIVAENFQKVENEFENAYSEIDEIKEKLEELDERVHDLEVRDDEDQTQFIQKMDDIEEDINSYQSRIGGLEKAFQQVLPSLVDNVRDLTQLVQEIKQERGIETQSDVTEDDIEDIDMEDW